MIRILLFKIIIISFCYCTIDYQPNDSILNNSKGVNLNIASWGWLDTENNSGFDLTELWIYATYYSSKKNYAIQNRYSRCSTCSIQNNLGIDVYYYNNFHKTWISKTGINYDSSNKTNIFHILTYTHFPNDFISLNFFIGQEYEIESKETHNTLSLTLQMHDFISPYISVWMKDDYNDNNIWLGAGISMLY